jgi:hypothetical protein
VDPDLKVPRTPITVLESRFDAQHVVGRGLREDAVEGAMGALTDREHRASARIHEPFDGPAQKGGVAPPVVARTWAGAERR